MVKEFLVAAAASALLAGAVPARADTSAGSAPSVSLARFEGRWIDLREGWGAARACAIYPGLPTQCFRTRQALEAHQRTHRIPGLNCSTPLKLYDGTYLSGATIGIYTRGLWINLADVGFDNRTSSFRVGACSIELAALTNGSGASYPRCLNAGCIENVMFTGWNNVVSSAYLH